MKMQMVLTFRNGVQVRVDVDKEPYSGSDVTTGAINRLRWNTPGDWSTRLIDFDMGQLACVHVERYREPHAPVPAVPDAR